MKSAISTIVIATCFFMTAGCSSQPKEFSDRKLVIPNKQTVKIKELDLSITNNGCGRQWESGSERPYCDLVIKRKDSTLNAGGDFKPVYIGNVSIQVQKINPWGREEDSIPPGGCRVWIRKLEGR
jgi:hypothetical protein